jgi:hypothetical protein
VTNRIAGSEVDHLTGTRLPRDVQPEIGALKTVDVL